MGSGIPSPSHTRRVNEPDPPEPETREDRRSDRRLRWGSALEDCSRVTMMDHDGAWPGEANGLGPSRVNGRVILTDGSTEDSTDVPRRSRIAKSVFRGALLVAAAERTAGRSEAGDGVCGGRLLICADWPGKPAACPRGRSCARRGEKLPQADPQGGDRRPSRPGPQPALAGRGDACSRRARTSSSTSGTSAPSPAGAVAPAADLAWAGGDDLRDGRQPARRPRASRTWPWPGTGSRTAAAT